MLDNVLREVGSSGNTERGFGWRFRAMPVKMAALAVLLLVAAPLAWIAVRSPAEPAFLTKGSGAPPLLQVSCLGPDQDKRCRQGHTLFFQVVPPVGRPFFASFARRDQDGLIIWYHPHAIDGTSRAVAPGVLPEGVRLDGNHQEGSYTIYGVFSATAMSRDQIRSLAVGDLLESGSGHTVTTVHLFVE